jgi:SAM-dependent methyltransferase
MKSLSFDRAAHIYDQTRGHPPEVAAAIGAGITAALPPGARLCELGIGTGRIARPTAAAGAAITGADLSRQMMSRIRPQLAAHARPIDLVQADVLALPFVSAAFDATLAVHVFHLIGPWEQAVAAALRLIRPGGLFLLGYDARSDDSPPQVTRDRWWDILAAHGQERTRIGPPAFHDLPAAVARWATPLPELTLASWTRPFRPAEFLHELATGVYSGSWLIHPDILPICLAELTAFLRERYGDLDQTFDVPYRFVLQRFQLPR